MRSSFSIVFAAIALSACGIPEPVDLQVQREVQLDDAWLVGVAVEPSGRVTVLDETEGVFALEGEDLVQIASPAVLEREGEDLRPYTDLVAMDDDVFAVTVQNDGLRLDVASQTTTQHFCYLPGGDLEPDGPAVRSQLTHSVGYDPELDVLFAQPQTMLDWDLVGAEVGTYSGKRGGQPEGWFELRDAEFQSHGMVWDDDALLLVVDTVLYRYALGDDRAVPYVDLGELGRTSYRGMVLRPDDTLVLVDHNTVLELTGWRPEEK